MEADADASGSGPPEAAASPQSTNTAAAAAVRRSLPRPAEAALNSTDQEDIEKLRNSASATIHEVPSSPRVDNFRKVSVLPLIFLIFYEVSGGWSSLSPSRVLGLSIHMERSRGIKLVMGLVSVPKLVPSRWLAVNLRDVNWNLYLNTLFWNLNYWDLISTLAGEVESPKKTLPRALFYALILVVLGYFFPLLIGTGSVPFDRKLWADGYFSVIAKIIGGDWLSWWVQAGVATSNMGLFVAEMSTDSFQLLGMAERGMLPEFFAKRSKYGTPLTGILLSASSMILLSWPSFHEIVAAENLLYCFGIILEFLAFVKLRIEHPDASRPYKIPVGTIGAIAMCIPPTILTVAVVALSTLKVVIVSLVAVAIGFLMQYVEKKKWLKFSVSSDLPDLDNGN